MELTYDRNSNITWALDKVHTGFDVYYTNDPLNRLTAADEGTENTGSITNRTRKQEWTLSHTGNWDREKLDLNGDGAWGGTNEHDDTRTHTKANAIATQDTDSNGTPNYTLTHDLVGNLTNDNQSYKYEWDVFGRLRKVKNQSNTLVAEYRYNGLGFRIAWHEDTDLDGDADASDKWFYPMYDEAWRMLAVFRESDSSPKEEWVPQLAGLDGYGRSSKLDGVICRYKDANNAWTAASDGVLEERRYFCQNWRGDVASVTDTNGAMVEWIKYLSYGIPIAMPAGDTNSDGDCDAGDLTQIQSWIDLAAFDVRGDLDLDGDVDATDKSTAQSSYQGTTLGYGVISNVGNRRGYGGYESDATLRNYSHVRFRVLGSGFGRWTRRDPIMYRDGANMFQYCRTRPMSHRDPTGTQSTQAPTLPAPSPGDIATTLFANKSEFFPNTKIRPMVDEAQSSAHFSFTNGNVGSFFVDDYWDFTWGELDASGTLKDKCKRGFAEVHLLTGVGIGSSPDPDEAWNEALSNAETDCTQNIKKAVDQSERSEARMLWCQRYCERIDPHWRVTLGCKSKVKSFPDEPCSFDSGVMTVPFGELPIYGAHAKCKGTWKKVCVCYP